MERNISYLMVKFLKINIINHDQQEEFMYCKFKFLNLR